MPRNFAFAFGVSFAMLFCAAAETFAREAIRAEPPPSRPYHELTPERRMLVSTPGLAGKDLASFLDRLEARGVRIPVAVANVGCIVVEEPAARSALADEPRVAGVWTSPVADDGGARAPFANAGLVQWWNEGFAAPHLGMTSPGPDATDTPICAGSRTLDEALLERGATSRCSSPSGTGRIHFASGRVVVSLIFPESEGPASIGDWTPSEIAEVEAELVRALHWWNLKSGGSVTFVLVNLGPAATSYEAGLLLVGEEELYINECLASLGFDGICGYAQLDDLNLTMTSEYGGHWGFAQFVLHANDFPGSLALAYAYLGGPHTVALLGNGSLGRAYLDRVMAHEIGHIFQALDEYDGGCGGCNDRSGYLNERNGNCTGCDLRSGKCVMRGSREYDIVEMNQMESRIDPCEYTKGMVGVRDANANGVLDVRETRPETLLTTALPDTLQETRNIPVEGRAWDLPFAFAPPRYPEPVTLNTIANVEFSVDGRGWSNAAARDGFWTSKNEEFQLRLPAVGGGHHKLLVRSMNSVLVRDPTPAQIDFFVYDVVLLDELEALQDGADLVLGWRVNGEDFGSRYSLYRREPGGEESLVATVDSQGQRNEKFRVRDDRLIPAHEYIYRLEVDIPAKGAKALGTTRAMTYLANPPPGKVVSLSPNPTRGEVLITVTVPRGPSAGAQRPPDEDTGGVVPPPEARGALRDESDPPPDSGPGSRSWREVLLEVIDLAGRRVRTLGTTRQLELSRFNRTWDGRDDAGRLASPGVYFLRTQIGDLIESSRITVVR